MGTNRKGFPSSRGKLYHSKPICQYKGVPPPFPLRLHGRLPPGENFFIELEMHDPHQTGRSRRRGNLSIGLGIVLGGGIGFLTGAAAAAWTGQVRWIGAGLVFGIVDGLIFGAVRAGKLRKGKGNL